MNIYSFSMLVIFLSGVGMAIFVLSRKRRATSSWTFSLVLFSSAIWSGSFVLLYGYSYTESQALLYSRCGHIGSLFIPIFFLHFTLSFYPFKTSLIIKAAFLILFSSFKAELGRHNPFSYIPYALGQGLEYFFK